MGVYRHIRLLDKKPLFKADRRLVHKAVAVLLACALLLSFLPPTAAKADPANPAKILFTLDDGWLDNYDYALPVFQAYGFPATVYVNSDMVDKNNPNFMTIAQLQVLYDNGWDLANHTASHHEIGMYNDEAHLEELRADYLKCKDWLIDQGFPRGAGHAAYPSGRYTKELIRVLQGIGMETGRTTTSGLQSTPVSGQDDYFTLPMKAVSSNYPLTSCYNAIDQAVDDGSTVIFMLHRVLPEQASLTTTVDDLDELLAYVKTNYTDYGLAEVLTISQWYDEQIVNPLSPVTPPAPPVTADDDANTAAGVTVIMEYSLDGGDYTAYRSADFNAIDFSGDHTLAVRYAASGINPVGPDAVLNFTRNLYTVSFQSNGGSAVEDASVLDRDLLLAPAQPERAGHTFTGWYKDEGLTAPWDIATDIVRAHTTLYARWDINHYAVTFADWDGGELKTESVPYQGAATAPADPERTGHTFAGWDNPFDSITGELVVTALYDPIRYTITFNKNGGGTEADPPTVEADYGTTIALPAPPAMAGYTCVGWNTEPDGSGTAFTDDTTVDGDMTVYAQWVQIPFGLTAASKSYNSIALRWSAAAGAAGYYVYRADAEDGDYSLVATTTALYYTDSGLATKQIYYYRIAAYATGGAATDPSETAQAKPLPAVPAGLKFAPATYNTVKLSWQAVAGADGYELWRAEAGAESFTKVKTVTTNSATDGGLVTNRKYYYHVRAYRMVGAEKVFGGQTGNVIAKPIPAAPTAVRSATAGSRKIKVSWAAVAGASGYQVFRRDSANGDFLLVGSTLSPAYTDKNLKAGTAYSYVVRAYRTVGSTRAYGLFSAVTARTASAR